MKSKIVRTNSSAKRGSSETKTGWDSESDEDEGIAQKKLNPPVSERIKDAAMHVLRSSRSLGSTSREMPGGLKKHFKENLPSASSSVATKPSNVPISKSSAFQPINAPSKTSNASRSKTISKDSTLSVRDRQKAYDEQVRKMNWKPLSIERPPPAPQPDKDAELLKAAHMEIFFPRNFGVPEDNYIFSNNEPSAERKSASVSPLSGDNENIPQPNVANGKPSLFISTNFEILNNEKEKVHTEPVAFVPARRPTKAVQTPALLRASIDPSRKIFVKPKGIETKSQESKPKLASSSKIKKKKVSKSKSAGIKPTIIQSQFVNRYDQSICQAPGYGLEDEDNVNFDNANFDDHQDDLGEFEFSSDDDEQISVENNSENDLADQKIEVPQIRESLSGRLNAYLGSRDVSILSGNTSALTGHTYSMNPVAKKTVEQALAFGIEPEIETKEQKQEILKPSVVEKSNRPPKISSHQPVKEFSKPISVALKSRVGSSSELVHNDIYSKPLKFSKSTFHYDPADDSDDINILSRLKMRGIQYHPYESDEESTGSLFRDEQFRDPEFGVVRTVMKKREEQYNTIQRRQKDDLNKEQPGTYKKGKKNQTAKSSKPYQDDEDDSYRSSLASSLDSIQPILRKNKESPRTEIDFEVLKDQIKREIEAERAEAQAADDAWNEIVPAISAVPRSINSELHAAPVTVPSNDRRGDAYRLRLEIMEELRKQDELFQYTLDLSELQNEMLQQQTLPTIIVPQKPQVAAEPPPEVARHAKSDDASQQLLEAANLNLFSTEQTILESEKLLYLYREIQDQQNRAAQDQLQQQQMATLYNLQTLPILQDIQQSMELLQQQQEMQQQQLYIQQQQMAVPPEAPPSHQPPQHHIKIVHEMGTTMSAVSSPIRHLKPPRLSNEIEIQTSPVKPTQTKQHPTFPYYNFAYPSTAEEEAQFLGSSLERSTETALLKLQKLEQRQKERMAWLDHVIRMHISTPAEAEEERVKIDELHRVELEQLRQSLRDSREKALAYSSVNVSMQKETSDHRTIAPIFSPLHVEEKWGHTDHEVSDRGRSFLHLSHGDDDEVLMEENDFSLSPESQDKLDYVAQSRSSTVEYHEVNDKVLADEQYPDKVAISPDSQRKPISDVNISHYYSLSEEDDEEKHDNVPQHESSESYQDQDNYEIDEFEASKSYAKDSRFIRSEVSFADNEYTQEFSQEYTQEFTQTFTQDVIPEEDDVDRISQSHVTMEVSEDDIRKSHDWRINRSKLIDDESEVVEEDISRAKSVDEVDEHEIEDEEIIVLKSTHSVVYEVEDDHYEDDFVASRSHSHIAVSKSVPVELLQSASIEYCVDDFEVDATKYQEDDNQYEDTFLSVQRSEVQFPTQQVDIQHVSVPEPAEESISYEEENEYEPDYEHTKSVESIQSAKVVDASSAEEKNYENLSSEFSMNLGVSTVPPATLNVSASEYTEISAKGKEESVQFEEEEDQYEDDFAADISRSSSGRWTKLTSEPPTTSVEKEPVVIRNAQQDEEVEDEVIEEIESELEEDEEEEEKESKQQYIAESRDEVEISGKEFVGEREDEYGEVEDKFEDDFEEESAKDAITLPVVEVPVEEYGDEDFDVDFDTTEDGMMEKSNVIESQKIAVESNNDSTVEKNSSDVEEIPEIEEEFDHDFENHDDEEPVRAVLVPSEKTVEEPIISVVTSTAHHAIIMDEDEDGALILDDGDNNGDLFGVELRKRLIHAATRSSDSHPPTLTQQMSSPPQVPVLSNFSSSSSSSSMSSPLSTPGVALNVHPDSSTATSNKVISAMVTTAPIMTRATSSGSMHYDPDAQRWVGGDDVSLAGFSSTSSSSPRQSSHTSPKTSTAASIATETENDATADALANSEDECFVPKTLSQSSLLILADEEEGIEVDSTNESEFLAEKEETYIPIVRKPASFATSAPPAAVTVKPVEAQKTKGVFEDDLEAFLDGLDDDDDDSQEKSSALQVVTTVPPHTERTTFSSTNTSTVEVDGSSSLVVNENEASDAKIEKISDLLVEKLVRDAVIAAQEIFSSSAAVPLGVEDAPLLLEAYSSSFLLDESQSFAHSSQDDSQLRLSVPIATVSITAADVSDDDVLLQKSAIDESQSIILASNILDEEDDSRQASSTSASSLMNPNTSQQNVTTNTSVNTSVVLAQLDQQSPLTTLDDAMRVLDACLSLLDFDLVRQQLVSSSAHPLPLNFLPQCLSQRQSTSVALKEWQKQVHFDRFEATLRAIHRIHRADIAAASPHPRPVELTFDDDDLDPLIVHVFQPTTSAPALKHFMRHHLQREIAGLYSLDNPHYLQRLQQHQQATVSAAVNLSNLSSNNINSHHLNSSNINTSMQSLHSQLSQTLQQAQQVKPQVRHWDWSIYDHGVVQRITRHTHAHIDHSVEHVADALVQQLVMEAMAARQKHQS